MPHDQMQMAGALASFGFAIHYCWCGLQNWGIVQRTVVPSSLSDDYSSALACSGLPTEGGCALWCGAHPGAIAIGFLLSGAVGRGFFLGIVALELYVNGVRCHR